MARCALFLTDLFGASGTTIVSNSGFNPSLPVANVSHPLPGKVAEQLEGPLGGGAFEVSSKTGTQIYVNEGGGPIGVTIPSGIYTASGLVSMVNAAFISALAATTVTGAYVLYYNINSRKFGMSAAPAAILSNDQADNVLTSECGYAASATASGVFHQADSERSSTITRVVFDAGAGNTLAPDLVWAMLNSTGGADTAAATLYNDVTMYANATYLGSTWSLWDSGASETIDLSDRPSESANTIQGKPTTGTGYRFWAFFWRHADDKESHQIGVLRGAAALTSSVHTVREVSSHHLANRTAPRTMENQHPVNLLSDWRMRIELERWSTSEYRALKVAADRYGAADGMLFSLLWTDIVAGSLTVNAQADKGQLFYGAIVGSSTDSYAGSESDYMTGSLDLAQLRGP